MTDDTPDPTDTTDVPAPVADGGDQGAPAPTADEPPADAPATEDDAAVDEPAPDPTQARAVAAARREAAGYRTKLRAAEGEVEALRAEVETHRRRQIDNVLTGTASELHDPGDLWTFANLSPADLFDDEGALDEDRLAKTLSDLRAARPYLFAHSLQTGPRDGGARGPQPQSPSFGAALRRAAGS